MTVHAELKDRNEDYHKDYDRISASMLKDFENSPEAFKGWYVSKTHEKEPPTRTMDVGSVVHAVFLEQKPLEEVVQPYPNYCLDKDGGLVGKKTSLFQKYRKGEIELTNLPPDHMTPSGEVSTKKATKEWLASLPKNVVPLKPEFYTELVNTPDTEFVLKQEDVDRCADIIQKLRDHEDIGPWIDRDDVIREQAIYWKEAAYNDLECRSKLDFVAVKPRQAAYIFDLKVTNYWREFWRYARNFNAHLSHAHYMSSVFHEHSGVPEGMPVDWLMVNEFVKMTYIAINPEWPHEISLWTCQPNDVMDAFNRRDHAIMDLLECQQTGDWRHKSCKTVNYLNFNV